jgi:hypothetical protein
MKKNKINKEGKAAILYLTVFAAFAIFLAISFVLALPVGPTVTYITNSTMSAGAGVMVNGSANDSTFPNKAGGTIYTVTISGRSQNSRWKAYVGNVTGTLTLDDADAYTVYDWQVTSTMVGEVYATRASTTVNWGAIECADAADITNEELIINHSNNPSDNISRTFDALDNQEFWVGSTPIGINTCRTTNLFMDDAAPGGDQWEEIVLTDTANIVYATKIRDNEDSYNTLLTTDFQLLVPEDGRAGWTSSIPYYFYVELD